MRVRTSRRALLATSGVVFGLSTSFALREKRSAAHGEGGSASLDLASVEMPPTIGQTELQVYVPSTGHSVGGLFLDYWRATGTGAVFGNPISEPFAAGGYYSQAFENAIFQYRPDMLYTVNPVVQLMPLGRMVLAQRVGTVSPDGRRASGGGNPRGDAWFPLARDDARAAQVVAEGGVFVEATGHTISGDFLTWYEQHEGDLYLGAPLGEPLIERGRTVQYFEGGLLIEEGGSVQLAPLAKEMSSQLGIDTVRSDRDDLPVYDEGLFQVAVNPNPLGSPSVPGPKRIAINLSTQQLTATQGETLITTGLVTSGLAPNTTEQGRFRVRLKYPLQDMAGFVDSTGEVITVGDAAASTTDSAGSYQVKDVPHVMYFNMDAEALHGAYWRDVFGEPGSHGCVNLPLDMAAFLYGWAPLGTQVLVYA